MLCNVDKINLNLNCPYNFFYNWLCGQEQFSLPIQIFLAFIEFLKFINKQKFSPPNMILKIRTIIPN